MGLSGNMYGRSTLMSYYLLTRIAEQGAFVMPSVTVGTRKGSRTNCGRQESDQDLNRCQHPPSTSVFPWTSSYISVFLEYPLRTLPMSRVPASTTDVYQMSS